MAGHSTAFPLSASAGEALVDYLRHGRPQTDERRVFFRTPTPVVPMSADAVSGRARRCSRRDRCSPAVEALGRERGREAKN